MADFGSNVGTNFVALANLVADELTAIATSLANHTHAGVTVGGGTSGVSNASPYLPNSVAASKVKAV